MCPSQFGCTGTTREVCKGIVRQYQQQIDDDLELIEEEPESHDPQILRHIVLLILLLCSMFVVRTFNFSCSKKEIKSFSFLIRNYYCLPLF